MEVKLGSLAGAEPMVRPHLMLQPSTCDPPRFWRPLLGPPTHLSVLAFQTRVFGASFDLFSWFLRHTVCPVGAPGQGGCQVKNVPVFGEMCILDFWEFCPKAHPPTPQKAFGDMHHTNTQHECTNLEDLAATDRRLCLSPHLGFAHLRLRHLRQITSHRKSEPK